MEALRQIESWGAPNAAAVAVTPRDEFSLGPVDTVLRWASVTKLLTALAVLVAVEEGTLELDEPGGPPGSTVRHLLAHASGLGPEAGPPIARPGSRRIYSNAGFETLADLLAERAEMPFADYLQAAVVEPLGLRVELRGSPAWGAAGPVDDLARLGAELLRPRLVARETLAEATLVQFPGLVGILPGFGRQEPNDWGLGFELRDAKRPHWTGERNSPATFGHFGQSGTFLWVDPVADVALACLTDRDFDEWAVTAWPRLSDDVLTELS